jgi:3-isopropylmalate/(R)-2-methylmalate dehydratase small subunit
VERQGFGRNLFYHWRYGDNGKPEPSFVLNQERYCGASILLARENFGCGSSREHAPWALTDFGFRAVIAPSFADIFSGNAFNNGLLLVELAVQMVDEWFRRCLANEGYRIEIDLVGQTLRGSDGFACVFGVDPFRKRCLLEGLDEIGLTMAKVDAINAFEQAHQRTWQAAVKANGQRGRE